MADVVTETLTFSDEGSIFLLPYLGFDSGLGTLTAVEASLIGTASIAEGEITGLTDDDGGFLSSFIFEGFIVGYINVAFYGPNRLGEPNIDFMEYSCGTPDGSGICTATYGGLSGAAFDDADSATNLAAFEQAGFLWARVGSDPFPYVGTLIDGPTTRWLATGNVTLEYVYDPAPVPLPAGLPLLMAGLGVLGLAARRRS